MASLNMSWAFRNDFVFYGVLGALALLPIVAAVAAIGRQPYRVAFKETRDFVVQLARVPGRAFWTALKVGGATSGAIVLLALAAYASNRLGDALLPITSSSVAHFGNDRVRWATTYAHDWEQMMFDFREVSGIKSDRVKWDRAKDDMGKADARFFRNLFVLAVLWLLASLVDVFSPAFRRRGITSLVLSVAALLLFQWLWIERESKFVENLVARYEGDSIQATNRRPPLPHSYRTVVLHEPR